jgi:hypothetical protein
MSKILVTGASGGIGAAICKALALRGVTVALHYQSDPKSAETTRRAMHGDGHMLIQADLTHPSEIERLWEAASATQPLDAIVNNAGIFPDHPPLTTDHANWTAAWPWLRQAGCPRKELRNRCKIRRCSPINRWVESRRRMRWLRWSLIALWMRPQVSPAQFWT